jgi:threonine dehydrogenase-like Zn-dependent dehydrogenase
MRAVVFGGKLQFRNDTTLRAPHAHEVLVDVTLAGICETDLQLCRGYMGFQGILGHEFVGIARSGQFQGKRVVGEINCSCHACRSCLAGFSNHCPNRTVIGILNHDGAFAETVIVPERNLHLIPDHMTCEQAVFVEPLAAACRIHQQISITGGEQVVVLGDGRLGNLCAQVLHHHQCEVTVVGKHGSKLQLLRDSGIRTILLDEIAQISRAEIVVDCTGNASGLATALRLVRPCGTIILKTTVAAESSLHLAPVVIDEIRVIGSRCGPFADAIQLLSTGAVRVESMIADRYSLEDADAAFQHAARKDTLKVLLDPTL